MALESVLRETPAHQPRSSVKHWGKLEDTTSKQINKAKLHPCTAWKVKTVVSSSDIPGVAVGCAFESDCSATAALQRGDSSSALWNE